MRHARPDILNKSNAFMTKSTTLPLRMNIGIADARMRGTNQDLVDAEVFRNGPLHVALRRRVVVERFYFGHDSRRGRGMWR